MKSEQRRGRLWIVQVLLRHRNPSRFTVFLWQLPTSACHFWMNHMVNLQQDRLESLLKMMGEEWKLERVGKLSPNDSLLYLFFIRSTLVAESVPCNLPMWNHKVTLETTHPHPETLKNTVIFLETQLHQLVKLSLFQKEFFTSKDALMPVRFHTCFTFKKELFLGFKGLF